MRLRIMMNMDNAAFDHSEGEVARILRELAELIEHLPEVTLRGQGPLMDINGNRVGEWKVTR